MFDRVKAGALSALAHRWDLGLHARHVEFSAVLSADDDPSRPSERLLDIAEAAIHEARSVSMESVSRRMHSVPRWPDIWPGEHYKLLAALTTVTRAKHVVEIGTYQGHGSLALLSALPPDGSITTFDLVPYQEVPGQIFTPKDFEDGRMTQVIGDLTLDRDFERHREVLRRADLVLVDAAKDGSQERIFLERFEAVGFVSGPLVVFDDIRLYNMLHIWRDVHRPKLDLTSFGHWSGTGLIDYA